MAGKVYETIIKVGASISKAFSSDAIKAAKSLAQLDGQAKKLQSATKSAAAMKRLEEAVSKSKAKYDTATEALRRLADAEHAAGGATKESTKWRKAGEREVAKAAKELDKATVAANRHTESLRKMRLEGEREKFSAIRTRLFGKSGEPTPLFKKAGEQIRGIARDAAVLGGVAIGTGVALGHLVKRTLETADEIGDTADKIGIGTTALQELRYGAQQSGAETADLDKSLSNMLKTVGRFKNAKKGAGKGAAFSIPGMQLLGEGHEGDGSGAGEADPFKRIGLNAKTLAALRPEEQLKKIAAGMQRLKTQADRAAVGQAIFGKSAKEIDPFLKEGPEGIERLAKAANKYGGLLTPKQIADADAADKALRDAKMAAAGLANTLGGSLLPVATKAFEGFSELVASNRGTIEKWAKDAAGWISGDGVKALRELSKDALAFAKNLGSTTKALAEFVGGYRNLGYVIAGARLAPLALTMLKIGNETRKAAQAFFDYSEAAKAARAAGGISEVQLTTGGKLLGLAATASMVAGAATVGYAIGTALDEMFGISDWLSKRGGVVDAMAGGALGVNEAGANAQNADHRAKLAKVKALQAKGLSYEAASGVVFRGIPAVIPKSGGGAGAPLIGNLDVKISGVAPGGIEAQVEAIAGQFKAKVMDALKQQQANERRLGFGQ